MEQSPYVIRNDLGFVTPGTPPPARRHPYILKTTKLPEQQDSSRESASFVLLTKNRASSHQVRDPHNSDHLPVIERLLFRALIASPNVVLLGCHGLAVLHDP